MISCRPKIVWPSTKMVQRFLPQATLWLASDGDGLAAGFMGLSPEQIDSLFIESSPREHGIGCRLVEHAASLHPSLRVDR
jgi:putative acetyltransferase